MHLADKVQQVFYASFTLIVSRETSPLTYRLSFRYSPVSFSGNASTFSITR